MIEQPSQVYSGGSASCGIAVMAKSSVPGLTKTRLVPPLTYDEAAAFNTAFLQDVAANIGAAARHAAIAGYMAFGPPGSENFFQRESRRGHRPHRSLAARLRRLPVHRDRSSARCPRLRCRAQFRQPDLADRPAGRNGARAGAAGRSRGDRAVDRRRILPARPQETASRSLRTHHLEHRARHAADAAARRRARHRRACSAAVVRRRRLRRAQAAARRAVRRLVVLGDP